MALDSVGICTNKNMVPYDTRKPMDPSGLRVGTAALTTRGFGEKEMAMIGEMISHVIHNHAHADVLAVVKGRVRELAAVHPLYEGWSIS